MVTMLSSPTSETYSAVSGWNRHMNRRMKMAKPAALGATEMNAVMGVGAPS
jgi:hypothetical protein